MILCYYGAGSRYIHHTRVSHVRDTFDTFISMGVIRDHMSAVSRIYVTYATRAAEVGCVQNMLIVRRVYIHTHREEVNTHQNNIISG